MGVFRVSDTNTTQFKPHGGYTCTCLSKAHWQNMLAQLTGRTRWQNLSRCACISQGAWRSLNVQLSCLHKAFGMSVVAVSFVFMGQFLSMSS